MSSAKRPVKLPRNGNEPILSPTEVFKPTDIVSHIRLRTGDGNKDEALTEKELKSMLKYYTKELGVSGGEKLPKFSLFTCQGDPTWLDGGSCLNDCPEEPLLASARERESGFEFLNELFPKSLHIRSVHYSGVRPIFALYRDDGFVTIVVMLGRSHRKIFCVIRFHHTPHLRCVSFVCCKDPFDLAEIRSHCSTRQDQLDANPMALLDILYDQRVLLWEEWQRDIYRRVNQIEVAWGMAPEGWVIHPPSRDDVERLTDEDVLSGEPAKINTEICHGRSMAVAGVRFARFCVNVANVIEKEACRVGNTSFRLEHKDTIEDQIMATESVCQSVLERFDDLGERSRGLINIVNNTIALKEMKISRLAAINSLDVARRTAIDSSIMKFIAVLGAVLLPATFTSSLWQAGVFDIEGSANVVVYTVVTVALTALIMTSGGLYMRTAGKSVAQQRDELGADPVMA